MFIFSATAYTREGDVSYDMQLQSSHSHKYACAIKKNML